MREVILPLLLCLRRFFMWIPLLFLIRIPCHRKMRVYSAKRQEKLFLKHRICAEKYYVIIVSLLLAVLRDKLGGAELLFVNTHLDNAPQWRATSRHGCCSSCWRDTKVPKSSRETSIPARRQMCKDYDRRTVRRESRRRR